MRDIKYNKALLSAPFKTFRGVVPFGMFVLPTLHLSRPDWCSGLMKQPNAMGSAGNQIWWLSPDLYALLYFRIMCISETCVVPYDCSGCMVEVIARVQVSEYLELLLFFK